MSMSEKSGVFEMQSFAGGSDLFVITQAKKLGEYVMTITLKSPAKFRGVFVNRMQNFCLDVVESLLRANFIKLDTPENKVLRENHQHNALIKLKLLSYVSMTAQGAGCITERQYKQIALQVSEVIGLTAAWKKSDDERWAQKENKQRV